MTEIEREDMIEQQLTKIAQAAMKLHHLGGREAAPEQAKHLDQLIEECYDQDRARMIASQY